MRNVARPGQRDATCGIVAAEGCPPKKAGGPYEVKVEVKGAHPAKAGWALHSQLQRQERSQERLCHDFLDGSRTMCCGLRNTFR